MARTTRSGKTFEYYPKLPSEVRMMINDEMDLKDMCRFSRCSRVCQKEVQKSEKCIYGLEFVDYSDQYLKIVVKHGEEIESRYHLVFQAKSGKKCIEYYIETFRSMRTLWSIDLDISTNLVQLATKKFKKLLNSYQNSIKLLKITGKRNYDLEIRHLNSLRVLEMNTCVDSIVEVISRREKPLKSFTYEGKMNAKLLEDDDYIYQIQEKLEFPVLKLNIEQCRRLSANEFTINIGDLTPNDIFNYIRSWQNGELRESFKRSVWDLTGSDFEIQQLWGLLRVTPPRGSRQIVDIEHNLDARKSGLLTHADDINARRLVFLTGEDNVD